MSELFYRNHLNDRVFLIADGDYTFLVGADSHITNDSARMDEMLETGWNDGDWPMRNLGDIADTKAEYYVTLDSLLQEAKSRYVEKNYTRVNTYEYVRNDSQEDTPARYLYDEIVHPFFLWWEPRHHPERMGRSNIFHSSFYEIDVIVFLRIGRSLLTTPIFLTPPWNPGR